MAKALNVADYIIYRANQLGKPVSNLQLQKIMYFLHAISLKKTNGKQGLVTDSSFERWDYGPVSPDVYSEYSNYGSSKIREPIIHTVITHDDGKVEIKDEKFRLENLSSEDKNIINENLSLFLDYNPFKLVEESHREPQWINLTWSEDYDDEKTYNYFKSHSFWEK